MKPLLIAAGICGLAITSHAQLDPSLVAWYKFDEGAGASVAANAVAGSSTGSIQSGITTGVAGISGNAYQFNGNATTGFVDMGNANFLTLLTTAGQLTFSGWVNTTDTAGDRNTVISAGNTTPYRTYSDMGVGRNVSTPANQLVGTARNRPTGTGDTGAQPTGIVGNPTAVNNGQWHHIAMTVNTTANQIILYVDGVQIGDPQTMTTNAIPTYNYFQVGRLTRNNNNSGGSTIQQIDPYLGFIDDVQVYNAALTADQIAWLHANPGEALTVVPEPAEVSVAIAAGLGLLIVARRRRAAKSIA